MSTAAKCIRRNESDTLWVTASTTVYSGDPVQLEDGRAGVKAGLETASSGDLMSVDVNGIFDIVSASATLFSKGDEVWWDSSASQAVPASGTLSTSDFYLGIADAAKVNGELAVRVDLNATVALRPIVHEFDCETGVDATEHILVPAVQNSNGLVLELAYGIVTEVFAGGDEDQGIVTIKDTADNVLATLTPSNAGADATGDVVIGTAKLFGGATGDAVKTIAKGVGIKAAVTQATAGAGAAGKMRVYLKLTPLV